MKTPHKHADLIKAWADGAEIEVKSVHMDWTPVSPYPSWALGFEYRIKPEQVYPKSSLSNQVLFNTYLGYASDHPVPVNSNLIAFDQMRRVADAAIKQYIIDTEAGKV